MSTAADYRSDSLDAIDFDIPCAMVWGFVEQQPVVTCGPVDAVADVDYISNSAAPVSKFACGHCVAKLNRQGRLLGVRYF